MMLCVCVSSHDNQSRSSVGRRRITSLQHMHLTRYQKTRNTRAQATTKVSLLRLNRKSDVPAGAS